MDTNEKYVNVYICCERVSTLLWSRVTPGSDYGLINKYMLTDTEWGRLLNPLKTAHHVHVYANEVYNREGSVEPHIIHTLKCLSTLNKREQLDWYILEDTVYHVPTYEKIKHRYSELDGTWHQISRRIQDKHAHSSE